MALTSNHVREALFPTVLFGAGYDMKEVDVLLDRLAATLETYERGASSVDLSSSELERAVLAQTRLREGYDVREVDALISEAVQTLREYEQSAPRAMALPKLVANDAMAESEAVSLSDQRIAVPVADRRPGDAATSPDAGSRGPDWANAGATLGVWLSGPIVGSVAFKVFDGQPDAWWLVLLWGVGLSVGSLMAWEAWHGLLNGRTLRRSPDNTELSGRTAWPIRRRRSIRLDQLTHVSYRMIAEQYGLRTYFVLRDHRGVYVMLEDKPDARNDVLAAVTRQPGVQIGYVASRKLAGTLIWWIYPVAIVGTTLLLAGAFLAAFWISAAMGAVDSVAW